jgi:hypothetical protein
MARAERSGVAQAVGHRTSRANRVKMLRWATLEVAGERGDVRIRNMSTTGAMIDGIEFPDDCAGTPVRIELTEGRFVAAELRWSAEGRAGIQFAHPVSIEQLAHAKPGGARRKA